MMKNFYNLSFSALGLMALVFMTGCTLDLQSNALPNANKTEAEITQQETGDESVDATPDPEKDESETMVIEDPERCPQGGRFICGPVTQGQAPDPDNPAPIVCACAPTKCPAGKSLVSSASTEQWPDGTYKGSYGCSSMLPPSAPNNTY